MKVVKGAKEGKVNFGTTAKAGNGSGLTKRDSAVATGTSNGGKTLKYRQGTVTKTTGSNAKYR